MVLTVGSLFAGIGGLDLGLERAGMRTVWVCESDPFCQFVLAKHFPSATRYADVRAVSAHQVEQVDVLVGGFPCQDISIAGNSYRGSGIDGKKSGLWSEFARLIRELRPSYAVIENASMLAQKGLDRVLCDLADGGYDAEWSRLSASSLGAPHIRERIYIVAYPHRDGREGGDNSATVCFQEARWKVWRDGALRSAWWSPDSEPQRVDDGVSVGVDATWRARVRTLGNAAIPQIAHFIGEGIVADQAKLDRV